MLVILLLKLANPKGKLQILNKSCVTNYFGQRTSNYTFYTGPLSGYLIQILNIFQKYLPK